MTDTPTPETAPEPSAAEGVTAAGITITRIIEAPRFAVFAAWTTPAQFAHWFGTVESDIPVESVSMDARAGGHWRATMFAGPDRREIPWAGTYIEVVDQERLVFTLSDNADAGDEIITVEFTELGAGTEMTFYQVGGHLTVDEYDGARTGWLAFFDSLAELVTKD